MAGLLACYCRSMIPYDDLVVALTAWRARQGLPIGRSTAAAAIAASPPPPVRPNAAPAAPARPAPPRPAPAPQAPPAEHDFEDSALIEDASDDADDYVMQIGEEPGEATAIGAAPEPPSPGKHGKRW